MLRFVGRRGPAKPASELSPGSDAPAKPGNEVSPDPGALQNSGRKRAPMLLLRVVRKTQRTPSCRQTSSDTAVEIARAKQKRGLGDPAVVKCN